MGDEDFLFVPEDEDFVHDRFSSLAAWQKRSTRVPFSANRVGNETAAFCSTCGRIGLGLNTMRPGHPMDPGRTH
ncbi:MAG: hypothetical protein R6U57_13100 [Anaerolineales bacterium]